MFRCPNSVHSRKTPSRVFIFRLAVVLGLVLSATYLFFRGATRHLSGDWWDAQMSRGGLCSLSGLVMEFDIGHTGRLTFAEFTHFVHRSRPSVDRVTLPDNPFPGILPSSRKYRYTVALPQGAPPSQVPLLWDVNATPDGYAIVLFWSGRVTGARELQLGDLEKLLIKYGPIGVGP